LDENFIALCRRHHDAAHGVHSREVRKALLQLKSLSSR
jgi:hypothetical protein